MEALVGLLVPGRLSGRRDRRTARALGTGSAVSTGWRRPTTACFWRFWSPRRSSTTTCGSSPTRSRSPAWSRESGWRRSGRKSGRCRPMRRAHLGRGCGSGVLGLLVGAGLTQVVRKTFSVRVPPRGDGLRRRHADGDDRCIPGLAGGRPHFFPRLRSWGWATRSGSCCKYLKKWLSGEPIIERDRELPYGPYLSMAAATLLFSLALALAGLGSESL